MPVAPHAMRTEELDYHLPPERIAARPVEPRDSARMLVVRRSSDETQHRCIRDLPEYLRAGDAMVFNTTSVVPARLIGRRPDTLGKVEGLFLHEINPGEHPIRWRVMLKAGGRLQAGDRIELLDARDRPSTWTLRLVGREDAEWIAEVERAIDSLAVLESAGRTPLPPYILKARGDQPIADQTDRQWYQTVYANRANMQSVAAPTAGLHFTPELLARMAFQGVERIDVTLHVGAGTFKPVTAATLAEHTMHTEWFEVSRAAIGGLHRVRAGGSGRAPGRVFAVGTTSVRTLESLPSISTQSQIENCGPISGLTDLLIAPPYDFKHVDGMLTNFHLPRSTLLALVAAMVGLDRLKSIYQEAIERGYRFYSYGDAMLVLP